jgi:sulfur-carrier protein
VKVLIPSALHSYTRASEVDVTASTVGEMFRVLDDHFPGLRFRVIDEQDCIRRHMRCFVNQDQTYDLAQPLSPTDEVIIMQALSGG